MPAPGGNGATGQPPDLECAAALTLQCAARAWLARGERFERTFARAFEQASTASASPAAQGGTRKLRATSVTALLEELERDPDVAAFCAYNDFSYKGTHATPKAERE